MTKIFMVAGLGFGDEGKGTITEYLTIKEAAHTVVRYNGGAQAAHHVVLDNGKVHTFSQFGSGTLAGAATHLSRFMIIDPHALVLEATSLNKEHGISNPFDLLTVERGAPLVTPYHKGANRLREFLRGPEKHGSVGAGVGETVSDHLTYGDAVPKIEDLWTPAILADKLSFIREMKLKEFSQRNLFEFAGSGPKKMFEAFNMLTFPVKHVLKLWDIAHKIRLVSKSFLGYIIDKPGAVIFEGAQGMLLDQTRGFHPHTTWSDTSFRNADTLLNELDHVDKYTTSKIGVIRTYLTRHGAGPFPTEIRTGPETNLEEKHNGTDEWQGSFRVGHFDMMLLKYALDTIGPIDSLALTHTDYLPYLTKMCISYNYNSSAEIHKFIRDGRLVKYNEENKTERELLAHQERLGNALSHDALKRNYWPVNNDFIDILEDISGIKVGIKSRGPTFKDKSSL